MQRYRLAATSFQTFRHYDVRLVTPPDKRARQKERSRAAREAREAAAKRERRKSMAIRFGVAGALVAIAIGVASVVGGGGDDSNASSSETTAGTETTVAASNTTTPVPLQACATITTNFGVITAELDTGHAPIAAGHFIELANKGFYDGLTWHRAVKDFVIQGGDPEGTGSGGSGSSVVGEVPTDHYPVGSLAAAKTGTDPAGTFDSQFFIVTGADQGKSLPNEYASFGNVTSGMDVVKKIEAIPVNKDSDPGKGKATIETIAITESGGPG
jgi:peptidyl-prolyl cis-trans isomerase B (cyclophilin B)